MLNKIKENITSRIDIWLLISMMLILNVSTMLKLVGFLILFLYKPTILKNIRTKGYPVFYFFIIGVILLQLLFSITDLNSTLLKINSISVFTWGLSLVAIIQINKIVSDTTIQKIQNTLIVLFIFNSIVSFVDLVSIMIEIKSINPYTYRGMVLNHMTGISKYGGATGDHIMGIFKTHSLHNAFFNIFGTVYFLINRKYWISIICLVTALLTTSNIGMIFLFIILISILLFHRSIVTKYIVFVHFFVILIFYVKVSPNNLEYIERIITKKENNHINNQILQEVESKKTEEIKDKKIAKYIASKQQGNRDSKRNSAKNGTIITNSIEVHNDSNQQSTEGSNSKISLIVDSNFNRSLDNIVVAANKDSIVKKLQRKEDDYDDILSNFDIPKEIASDEEQSHIVLNDNVGQVNDKILKKSKLFEDEIHLHQQNLTNKVIEVYGDSASIILPDNLKKYPGKAISFIESVQYLCSSPKHFAIGSGAGQFSSKLAFGISGFSVSGDQKRFLNNFVEYVSLDFKENHLKLFSYFWLQDPGKHSIVNEPFSSYNQLVGEYGIIGLLGFVIFYLMFYIKRFKLLFVGKYLIVIMLMMLLTDYWFEHLNNVIIFELLMFLDLKRAKENNAGYE